jgi:hypothetical protein
MRYCNSPWVREPARPANALEAIFQDLATSEREHQPDDDNGKLCQ